MYDSVFQNLGGITTAGIWVAALGVVGLLIRQFVPWLKQTKDADARLIELLMARVGRLEEKVDRYERRSERQERRHALEQRHSAHKFRNVTACFDAILTALKVSPDKAPLIVEEIMKLRAQQQLAEAEEFKAISDIVLADPDDEIPS